MINPDVAIVVGGADSVWTELAEVRQLCARLEMPTTLYVINDMIARFPEEAVGVTLHPDKLRQWLAERAAAGHPPLGAIWTHRQYRGITTNVTSDWGGSSGLFATKIAIQCGHSRVIGCGVPMIVEGGHFVRHQRWEACSAFRKSWEVRAGAVAPHFRSMSGWTAEKFGRPSAEWLGNREVAA